MVSSLSVLATNEIVAITRLPDGVHVFVVAADGMSHANLVSLSLIARTDYILLVCNGFRNIVPQ